MELVQRFCAEHQLPCYVEQVDVRGLAASEHLSIEAAARRLRHKALKETMQLVKANAIVFAHNLDDQAETVLLRLLRGTSLTGLCGIRGEGHMGLRPFLELRHRQLAQYCELMGVAYCHDSTNDDLAYTRNRVRHELMPYLEQHFNSNVKETLARMAEQLGPEEELLARQALEAYAAAKLEGEELGRLAFAGAKLLKLPTALRRRVLRQAYYSLAFTELDYERTMAVEKLLINGTGGKLVQLPGDVRVIYKNKQLIFEKQ